MSAKPGMFGGAMRMFRSTPAAPAGGTGAPATPSSQQATGTGTIPGAGGTPADGGTGKTGEAQTSPLDPFKDLWNNEPAKGADGKPIKDGKKSLLNIDPAKVAEAAKKMSYSGLVPPELMQKALSGDSGSMGQILDAVGQAGFTHAFTANGQMMERMAEVLEGRIRESLPGEVRKHSLKDSVLSQNPKLNNPAIRPLVEAIQQQILQKFPDATQAEVQEMSSTYMTNVFKELGGTGESQSTGTAKGGDGSLNPGGESEMDWGAYFGLTPKT